MAEPPSPQQPAAAPLDAAARRQAAQASTSGSYDYVTAIQRVQNRIQELSSERDQYRQSPSLLRNSVRYWRSNWSNILVLLSLYSMTTATVMSVFFSERQKQVSSARGRRHQHTRSVLLLQSQHTVSCALALCTLLW